MERKQLTEGKTEVQNETVFELLDRKEVAEAIRNLVLGQTPKEHIRERVVGGGKKAKYVNTYYMTRQISLITRFRWSSECLEEKTYPANPPHKFLGAKMKVTIWDKVGNQYSHISWGEKPITEGTGYFDQWKAAYSDGIKKCLSYFGIANDVYGGRDLEFLGEEPPDSPKVNSYEGIEQQEPETGMSEFLEYLKSHNILLEDALKTLEFDSIDDIENWELALDIIEKGK